MITRLIVMVTTVVLLGGGGAATWLFFSKPDSSDEKPAAVVDPTFTNIGTLSIPVIRDGQVRKYVLLRLTLELVDRKAKALAEEAMPRLRDAFLEDLYGYFANQMPGQEGINVTVVKARLKDASDKAVGPGVVKEVLIQGAFERAWKPQ